MLFHFRNENKIEEEKRGCYLASYSNKYIIYAYLVS